MPTKSSAVFKSITIAYFTAIKKAVELSFMSTYYATKFISDPPDNTTVRSAKLHSINATFNSAYFNSNSPYFTTFVSAFEKAFIEAIFSTYFTTFATTILLSFYATYIST